MVELDGILYDVPFRRLARVGRFDDKYMEATEDGQMQRELRGIYTDYSMEFSVVTDWEEYNRFWNKLMEPVEFHTITVPTSRGRLTFEAYITNISDEHLAEYNDQDFFKDLTVEFSSRTPERTL